MPFLGSSREICKEKTKFHYSENFVWRIAICISKSTEFNFRIFLNLSSKITYAYVTMEFKFQRPNYKSSTRLWKRMIKLDIWIFCIKLNIDISYRWEGKWQWVNHLTLSINISFWSYNEQCMVRYLFFVWS